MSHEDKLKAWKFIGEEFPPAMLDSVNSVMEKIEESEIGESTDALLEIVKTAIGLQWGFGSAKRLEKLLKEASDESIKCLHETLPSTPLLNLEVAFREDAIKGWSVTNECLPEDEGEDVSLEFIPKFPLKRVSSIRLIDADE